jgi:hypothetical protein
MIRHNKSLQYLDLENCGLSHKVFADVIPNLTRAKSLLSFHFGYNPGLDRQLKNLIKKKCHIAKKERYRLDIHLNKNAGVLSPDL